MIRNVTLLHVWMTCITLASGSSFARVNQAPESFTLDFQQENTAPAPPWIAGVNREGGAITGDPLHWQITDEAPEQTGRLVIHLHPDKLPADLSLSLVYEDLDDSEFLIQLLDARGDVLVPDMFSRIVDTARETRSATFIINFLQNAEAKSIAIQRIKGPLRLYGLSLAPVVCEIPSVVDIDRENCLAKDMSNDTNVTETLNQLVERLAGDKLELSKRIVPLSQQESPESIARALLAADPLPDYVPEQEVSGKANFIVSATSFSACMAVARAVRQWHPNLEVKISYEGTTEVEKMFLAGETKMIAGSHFMSLENREKYFEQWKQAPRDFPFAMDALQVIVHKDNPITHITLPELEAIYAENPSSNPRGSITAWSEVGENFDYQTAMTIYGGQPDWGTSRSFAQLAMQGKPFHDRITFNSVMHPDGIQQNVAQDPGGIGFLARAPLALNVRVIPVAVSRGREAYLPNAANMYSGAYPLARNFYITIAADDAQALPAPERELLNFILTKQGQTEIAKNGLLPLTLEQLVHARKLLKLD